MLCCGCAHLCCGLTDRGVCAVVIWNSTTGASILGVSSNNYIFEMHTTWDNINPQPVRAQYLPAQLGPVALQVDVSADRVYLIAESGAMYYTSLFDVQAGRPLSLAPLPTPLSARFRFGFPLVTSPTDPALVTQASLALQSADVYRTRPSALVGVASNPADTVPVSMVSTDSESGVQSSTPSILLVLIAATPGAIPGEVQWQKDYSFVRIFCGTSVFRRMGHGGRGL